MLRMSEEQLLRHKKRVGKVVTAKTPAKRAKSRPKASQTPEKDILRACLQLLAVHPAVAFAFRANAGGMQNPVGQWVKFGFRGMPDILGMVKGGRFLAVEVKRPGKKPTPDQDAFLRRVNEAGGLGFCADSLARLEFVLKWELDNTI